MGKGDKKSRRGKITNKTYGVRRPRKKRKPVEVKAETKPKPKAASKPAAKPKTTKAKAAKKDDKK